MKIIVVFQYQFYKCFVQGIVVIVRCLNDGNPLCAANRNYILTVNSQHLLKYAHYRFWILSVSLSMWFSDAHHTHPMYKIVCEYVFTKHIFLV